MTALLTYYRAQIKTALTVQLQYRVALMIWMIELVLQPIIYLVVWSTVARSSGGQVGSYNPAQFAGYYLVMMIVNHFTMIWHMWEYEYLIKEGILSQRLLRPLHPIHEDAAYNLSYKFLMLIVLIPAVALIVVLFQPTLNPPLWAVFAFLPCIVLAGVLAFAAGWTLAMAAFWTTRIFAVNQMYFVAMLFFSGYIAPLELLPAPLQTIANLLPFRWMLAFPTELLTGRVPLEQLGSGLAAQAAWCVLCIVLLRVVYRAGIRRYGAVGG